MRKYKLVVDYARAAPLFPEDQKIMANRVMGCTAQVGPPAIDSGDLS